MQNTSRAAALIWFPCRHLGTVPMLTTTLGWDRPSIVRQPWKLQNLHRGLPEVPSKRMLRTDGFGAWMDGALHVTAHPTVQMACRLGEPVAVQALARMCMLTRKAPQGANPGWHFLAPRQLCTLPTSTSAVDMINDSSGRVSLIILFRQSQAKSVATQAPATHKAAKTESNPLLELQLYNTMGRRKQIFRPRQDQGQNISMYVCGVTVYDWYVP